MLRSEHRGVIGVIIFSDPYDYTYPNQEYPNGWMLNKYGVQRGTINRLNGDALSLGYPSKGLSTCYIEQYHGFFICFPSLQSKIFLLVYKHHLRQEGWGGGWWWWCGGGGGGGRGQR